MSNLLKNLIIALCITILLGVVYFFTIGGSSDDEIDSATSVTTLSSEAAIRTQRILADTKRIDQYTLPVSIFDDVRFASLRDYRIRIPDVPAGRTNPFAPIE